MRSSLRQMTNTDVVPLDLLIEILIRLPVKSVVRFLLVSKSWKKLINSVLFIRSFPHRSLTQPCRLLIAFKDRDRRTEHTNWYFFSSSSTSTSTSTSTSFLSKVKCPFSNPWRPNYYTYVNGLMSIGYTRGTHGRGHMICNPCTGKFITLPGVNTTKLLKVIRSFFGYDPVDSQYKVFMHLKTGVGSADSLSEIKVFTLGAKRESWRLIDCSIPHTPWSHGLCMDGVVYYLAHTGTGMTQLSLMSFDVKSEKFDIAVKISDDLNFSTTYVPHLLNYHGKVAVQTITPENGNGLWILEARKQAFLEMSFDKLEHSLQMKGINHMGEIIFATKSYSKANVTLYDRKGETFKNMKMNVVANAGFFCWDVGAGLFAASLFLLFLF